MLLVLVVCFASCLCLGVGFVFCVVYLLLWLCLGYLCLGWFGFRVPALVRFLCLCWVCLMVGLVW